MVSSSFRNTYIVIVFIHWSVYLQLIADSFCYCCRLCMNLTHTVYKFVRHIKQWVSSFFGRQFCYPWSIVHSTTLSAISWHRSVLYLKSNNNEMCWVLNMTGQARKVILHQKWGQFVGGVCLLFICYIASSVRMRMCIIWMFYFQRLWNGG